MRNKRFILLSLMAMILMVAISCHSNNKYDQMMERVDSIMNENDESATLSIKIPQFGIVQTANSGCLHYFKGAYDLLPYYI